MLAHRLNSFQLLLSDHRCVADMELHDMKYGISGNADLYNYLLAHSYRPNEHLEGLHKVPKFGV